MKRPLIGVTCRLDQRPGQRPPGEWFYLQREYCEAVWAAGGLPVQIPLIAEEGYARELIARLDGVVLSGSASDVDPARYGAARQEKCGETHPEKDAVDIALTQLALETHKPLLGICFGAQAMNVALGGTLIQSLETPLDHRDRAARHEVRLEPDSTLARIGGGTQFRVNTSHHQAIERVGHGLRVTARCGEVIEGVESTDPQRFLIGVQWHPERIWNEDKLSHALFQELVARSS
jgi:putative glutamine amidotransferase